VIDTEFERNTPSVSVIEIRMKVLKYSSLALVAAFMAGCSAPEPPPSPSPATVTPLQVKADSEAGIGAKQSEDAKTLVVAELAAAKRSGAPRKDPFEMKPYEKNYDVEQNTMRLVSTYGPFDSLFTPPVETDRTPPIIEDQPYRRLAGVVVGDSVLAIIDMGNGTTELIRPGQQIPNSEWKVVSIDQDKAVLRRGGTALPHEVTVRLESPPGGVGSSGSTFGGPPGRGPSGFGGPPGGMPPGAGSGASD